MLRKKDEMTVRRSEKARGGEGHVDFYDYLKPEESFGTGRMFARMVLPKGASIGMHPHNGEFEIYYVISGTGRVNDGTRDYDIAEGDMYLCPDGERHALYNTGDGELSIDAVILYPQKQ